MVSCSSHACAFPSFLRMEGFGGLESSTALLEIGIDLHYYRLSTSEHGIVCDAHHFHIIMQITLRSSKSTPTPVLPHN